MTSESPSASGTGAVASIDPHGQLDDCKIEYEEYTDYGSYCAVEVQGYFTSSEMHFLEHQKRLGLSSELLLSSGFHLCKCRLYDEEQDQEQEWYNIVLETYGSGSESLHSAYPHDEWSKTDSYRKMKDGLNRGLKWIFFHPQLNKWCPKKGFQAEKEKYFIKHINESLVLEGFLKGMDNSAGRTMVFALMTLLKPYLTMCEGAVRLMNVGGVSRKCSHVRQVHGIVIQDPFPDPTATIPDVVPPKIEKKAARGRSYRNPKHSTDSTSTSESPCYSVRKKEKRKRKRYDLDSLESEAEGTTYPAKISMKDFIPDFVMMSARSYADGNHPFVMLTATLTMGNDYTPRAVTQLLYEMLPIVMEQNETLGLLVSAGTALLVKMYRDKKSKQIKSRSMPKYSFIAEDGSFDIESFDKLCVDIIQHCHLVWEACCK